ncbi:ankyrin repeat-containing protein BDA1-like [Hibiscus syriacus]|uniref:ankyrin repeat-containing protein BDA1-like n=1 Tax=Hibiscus syriacus TaxID=106335 RepID=UPI00192236A3|nr:ankyrin repeat-containing protein BDA1-like [Hibiscus syriacus]
MDPSLKEAAETENIDALHLLIRDDPYILERLDQVPFVETPLHVAAGKLHVAADNRRFRFAMEMMSLKPLFTEKLNPNGFSPMHLALRTEQAKLVLRLLKTDKDLSFFLDACPGCIEDETALHLALKEDQIEAFTLLIGWLQRTRRTQRSVLSFEKKLANWKDDDGNTLLHFAAKSGKHWALKLLLDSQLWLHVNAKDSSGLTALDIIQGTNKRDKDEENRNRSDEVNTKINQLKGKVTLERIKVLADRTRHSMSVDMINTMLVIMALVITAIYQSPLSPPGSIWQDNGDDNARAPARLWPPRTSLARVHGSCNRIPPLKFSSFPAPCHPALHDGHLLLLLHDNLCTNLYLSIRQPFLLSSVWIIPILALLRVAYV